MTILSRKKITNINQEGHQYFPRPTRKENIARWSLNKASTNHKLHILTHKFLQATVLKSNKLCLIDSPNIKLKKYGYIDQ